MSPVKLYRPESFFMRSFFKEFSFKNQDGAIKFYFICVSLLRVTFSKNLFISLQLNFFQHKVFHSLFFFFNDCRLYNEEFIRTLLSFLILVICVVFFCDQFRALLKLNFVDLFIEPFWNLIFSIICLFSILLISALDYFLSFYFGFTQFFFRQNFRSY